MEARVELSKDGKYVFAPQGLDPRIPANGFQITLNSPNNLEYRIQDLLDNYEDRKDKPIEIRQK